MNHKSNESVQKLQLPFYFVNGVSGRISVWVQIVTILLAKINHTLPDTLWQWNLLYGSEIWTFPSVMIDKTFKPIGELVTYGLDVIHWYNACKLKHKSKSKTKFKIKVWLKLCVGYVMILWLCLNFAFVFEFAFANLNL
jgi:hypothetical protein